MLQNDAPRTHTSMHIDTQNARAYLHMMFTGSMVSTLTPAVIISSEGEVAKWITSNLWSQSQRYEARIVNPLSSFSSRLPSKPLSRFRLLRMWTLRKDIWKHFKMQLCDHKLSLHSNRRTRTNVLDLDTDKIGNAKRSLFSCANLFPHIL